MMTNQPPATTHLDSYFQRIGYSGDRSPTLAVLQAIHLHHAQTIAFENLNPLLQQPVCLDLPALQQKLIDERRGGYCFEQNLLLRSVLIDLGFQVTNLAARVLWNQPAGAIPPRSHMLLRVEIDGTAYLADVGFGGLTLTTPLQLTPDLEQPTPHEPFRLTATDRIYVMQARIDQNWKPLYQFDLQEQYLPDYEVSNWYVSTHPTSRFVTHLMVARPGVGCRYSLLDNQFTTRYLDDRTERQTLKTTSELRAILEAVFGLQLPAIARLDEVLQRFTTAENR